MKHCVKNSRSTLKNINPKAEPLFMWMTVVLLTKVHVLMAIQKSVNGVLVNWTGEQKVVLM